MHFLGILDVKNTFLNYYVERLKIGNVMGIGRRPRVVKIETLGA